jgi:hypothetical protein
MHGPNVPCPRVKKRAASALGSKYLDTERMRMDETHLDVLVNGYEFESTGTIHSWYLIVITQRW